MRPSMRNRNSDGDINREIQQQDDLAAFPEDTPEEPGSKRETEILEDIREVAAPEGWGPEQEQEVLDHLRTGRQTSSSSSSSSRNHGDHPHMHTDDGYAGDADGTGAGGVQYGADDDAEYNNAFYDAADRKFIKEFIEHDIFEESDSAGSFDSGVDVNGGHEDYFGREDSVDSDDYPENDKELAARHMEVDACIEQLLNEGYATGATDYAVGDLTVPVRLDSDSEAEGPAAEPGRVADLGRTGSSLVVPDGEEEEEEVHPEEEGDIDLFAADGVFEDDVGGFDEALGGGPQDMAAARRQRAANANAQPQVNVNVNVGANGANNGEANPVDPDLAAAQAAVEAELAAGMDDGGGFAVEELLGLRGGTLLRLVKNVAFLLLFNLVYIALVGLMPSSIGLKTKKAFLMCGDYINSSAISPTYDAVNAVSPLIFECIGAVYDWSQFALIPGFVNRVRFVSSTKNGIIIIDDIVTISLGYFSMFLLVSLLGLIFSSMVPTTSVTNHTVFRTVSTNILAVHKTAKVGSLLFLRILVLPLILGITLMGLINNYLLFHSTDVMSSYVAKNILGSGGLAWVIGITFMLVITLSILQLREVLHPDLLGKVIRPQETQVELMQSLIYDNVFVHAKRMISSTLVYLSIACIYVYFPLKLYYTAVTWGADPMEVPRPLFTIYNGLYYCGEIQLPLELTVLHLCLLSSLEKRKNIIGRLQHQLLLFISNKLGIARMILPFRTRMRHGTDGTLEQVQDDNGEVSIKGPMKRPPKGWDSRKRTDVGRWSWIVGDKPPVEQEVAPRIIPANWLSKTAILFLLQWLVVIFFIFTHTMLPVLTGRAVMGLLLIPTQYLHDPLNYILGMVVLTQLFGVARYLVENNNLYACLETFTRLPMAYLFVLRVAAMFCIVSVHCGLVLGTARSLSASSYAAAAELYSGADVTFESVVGAVHGAAAGGFRSYGMGATCVSELSCDYDHLWTVAQEASGHLLYECLLQGAGLTTVVMWALCCGFVRQLLTVLRMVPVVGNIGGHLQALIPDWNGIVTLFVRDVRAGAIERVLIHMQLFRTSGVVPLSLYFFSPLTYLNSSVAVVFVVRAILLFSTEGMHQYLHMSTAGCVSTFVAHTLSAVTVGVGLKCLRVICYLSVLIMLKPLSNCRLLLL